MIFSGASYRKIQETEEFSFSLGASVNNVTGSGVFGFSGANELLDFNFVSGRFIDTEEKYTFSYGTGQFRLSGNVSQDYYDYYFDNNLIVSSGNKNNFAPDRFYFDCSGLEFNVGSLIIQKKEETTFFLSGFESANAKVGDGTVFYGDIITSGATGRYDVFSGTVLNQELTGLFAFDTSKSTGILNSGTIGISGISGIEFEKNYTIDAEFITSFGKVRDSVIVEGSHGAPSVVFTVENVSELPTSFITLETGIVSGGLPNVEKTGNFLATHYLLTGGYEYETGLPLKVSLEYSGGYTGQITGSITGIHMLETGANYFNYTPHVLVSGNGNGAAASSTLIAGGAVSLNVLRGGSGYSSVITEATLTSSGSGYTGVPDVIINGNGQGGFIEAFTGSNGFLTGLEVISGGSGYTQHPTLTLNGGTTGVTGSGSATSSGPHFIIYSGISDIVIESGGHGYFSSPEVEFSGGLAGGTHAQVSALVTESGQINGFTFNNVTTAGTGYMSTPTFSLKPGLSGILLTNSGSGYTGIPQVVLQNGGGNGALFSALTGHGGFLTGFEFVSGGSGYTGVPNVIVSGETSGISGSGTAILSTGFAGYIQMPTGAEASGIIGNYTKEFTNQWNLFTGSGNNYLDYKAAGQISSDNLSYTGSIYHFKADSNSLYGAQTELQIKVTNLNYYDPFISVANLIVSGSGIFDTTISITGAK
tara:strand:- start:727 stop:2835 length:2109 start_codon:yes stop_codon:yes gene_type:complete